MRASRHDGAHGLHRRGATKGRGHRTLGRERRGDGPGRGERCQDRTGRLLLVGKGRSGGSERGTVDGRRRRASILRSIASDPICKERSRREVLARGLARETLLGLVEHPRQSVTDVLAPPRQRLGGVVRERVVARGRLAHRPSDVAHVGASSLLGAAVLRDRLAQRREGVRRGRSIDSSDRVLALSELLGHRAKHHLSRISIASKLLRGRTWSRWRPCSG